MSRSPHFTLEQFQKAIDGSGGFISVIADRVGCNLSTVYEWKKKHSEVQTAIDAEKVRQVDHAEGQLQALINEKNPTAIIFYLKTQGKQRGYVERQEVSGPVDSPLLFKWTEGD
jgi:hypothetical protein